MNLSELMTKSNDELANLATEFGASANGSNKRHDLVTRVAKAVAEKTGPITASGILSIVNDGYGFLRQDAGTSSASDVYVSQSQIRRFGLRTGDQMSGRVRPPKDGERYFGLVRVEEVNGVKPDAARNRPKFESLTPIFPIERLKLETAPRNLSTRLIDLLAPIGRGQRGLIVSPPKAGKTSILKDIAAGITANHPDVHIMVALIGERPEEVTDMRRSIDGEVYSSTFDEPVEDHCRVAEMVLERAKRLVEAGTDVLILLDSITRLTRAYNLAVPTSGRTLSGGMDPVALYPAQEVLRGRAQHRGGWQHDHPRGVPGRYGQPHGRRDLRGVQGHGQHGGPPRPPPGRAPHLSGHRHSDEAARVGRSCSWTMARSSRSGCCAGWCR